MADFETFTGSLDQDYESFSGTLDTPKQPKGLDLRKELARQLGLTGRVVATGAPGTINAIRDFAAGAANLAGQAGEFAASKIFPPAQQPYAVETTLPGFEPANVGGQFQAGRGFVSPSQRYEQGLTRLGVPEAKGPLENLVQFGGSALAGAGDPLLNIAQKVAAGAAPAGFQAAKQTAKAATAKELHEAGLKLEPTAVEGGKLARAAQGFGGAAHTATTLQNANQPVLQRLVARDVGLDPANLTDDALKAARLAHIKEGYDPIRALPVIRSGKLYRDALDDIASKYHPKSFPTKTMPKLVEDLNDLRVGGFKPSEALDKIASLRDKASDQFKPGGDTSYGKALREMAKALEDQIERNVKDPAMLDRFKHSRKELAKNYAVRDMLVDKSTGIIDSTKAAKLLADDVPLSGNLLTVAKAGGPLYAHSTAPPIRGKGLPFNWGDAGLYGGASLLGAGAAPFTGGMSLALPAALPFARAGARRAITSDMVQRAMVGNMQGAPSMFGAPAARVAAGMPDELLQLFGGQ